MILSHPIHKEVRVVVHLSIIAGKIFLHWPKHALPTKLNITVPSPKP